MRNLSVVFFIVFYGIAGVMHFITPEIYVKVIPSYLGDQYLLNYLAGAAELIIALLAIFKRTRATAGWLTILILAVFIISHVYFIQLGGCAGDICLPTWVGWFRLIAIHPLLIYWAYRITKS